MTRRRAIAGALLTSLLSAAATVRPAAAQPAAPSPFSRIGLDQKVGEQVPANLPFRDEQGRTVRLGSYFGQRPVLMALVYYNCPMLCTLTLNGLTRSLKGVTFDAGRDFQLVIVSIDPRETPAIAARSRLDALARYSRPGADAGFHFLTGSAASIAQLTKAIGFRYYYDETVRQYAHAAGLMVLTPDGRLSRYFYGIEFPSRSLRLALYEAADRKIGSVMDQVLLYCFHYDPVQGRYSAVTLNIVRLGGVLTLLGLGVMIVLFRRHDHRPKPLGNA
jgi:protein SCO1/2